MSGQYDPLATGPEPPLHAAAHGATGHLTLASPRDSMDSVGSGSDLVYRDVAEVDPFEEKAAYRDEDDDNEPGFVVEPRRVSTQLRAPC